MRQTRIVLTALSSLALAACQTSVTEPSARHAQTAVVAGASPLDVYTVVARNVRSCWLNPADPVLAKHVFHAVANADGSGTNIVIHERGPDGRRGLKAYTIRFEPKGADTRVVTESQRVAYPLSQKLSADIGRWVQGGTQCVIAENRGSAVVPSAGTALQRGAR